MDYTLHYLFMAGHAMLQKKLFANIRHLGLSLGQPKVLDFLRENDGAVQKEIANRYILLVISLFFSALGVAVTKHGELGVSPISSTANVLSSRYTALSLGTWLIIWNCILILGQILILRTEFKIIQLLQIPLSFIFGYFTDFGMWCVSFFPAEHYITRLILVLCGIIIMGFGISLSVISNVIMNSGEAFVKAVADKTGKNFGNIKIGFDVICVIISIALSLLLFHGEIIGTREGTIISALLTGVFVKLFTHLFMQPFTALIS